MTYFNFNDTWKKRLKDQLKQNITNSWSEKFQKTNATLVKNAMKRFENGARAVANVSPTTLLAFLKSGQYYNTHDLVDPNRTAAGNAPRLGSSPSKKRRSVDTLISNNPPINDKRGVIPIEKFYFTAMTINGEGIRYYGSHGLVLRRDADAMKDNPRLIDRNSYDFRAPPLQNEIKKDAGDDFTGKSPIVAGLQGTWEDDLSDMVAMRLLELGITDSRRLTTGIISDEVLQDEDYTEVILLQSFVPKEIEEVRISADSAALEAKLRTRKTMGQPLTRPEQTWLDHCNDVRSELESHNIPLLTITTSGRVRHGL